MRRCVIILGQRGQYLREEFKHYLAYLTQDFPPIATMKLPSRMNSCEDQLGIDRLRRFDSKKKKKNQTSLPPKNSNPLTKRVSIILPTPTLKSSNLTPKLRPLRNDRVIPPFLPSRDSSFARLESHHLKKTPFNPRWKTRRGSNSKPIPIQTNLFSPSLPPPLSRFIVESSVFRS